MFHYRVVYKKAIRKSRARTCAEPKAGEPRGRTRPARGVPRRRRGSLTLRATSRQLRGACGSPAVRRVSSKNENAARMSACGLRSSFGVCVCEETSRRTLSRTHHDGCLMRVNVKGGVDVSNGTSCKDRKITRPNNCIVHLYEFR